MKSTSVSLLLASVMICSSTSFADCSSGCSTRRASQYSGQSSNQYTKQYSNRYTSGNPARRPTSRLSRHVNKLGRFEALMPSNTVTSTVEPSNIVDTQYHSKGSAQGAEYKIRVQVISPINLNDESLDNAIRDQYVGQAREQQQKAFGAAKTDKAIKQHGIKGQEFTYSIPAGRSSTGKEVVIRKRILFDGQRLYIVTLSGARSAVNSNTGNEFLASVRKMQTR